MGQNRVPKDTLYPSVLACFLPLGFFACPCLFCHFSLRTKLFGKEKTSYITVHWQARSNFKKCVTLQAARPLIRQLLYDVEGKKFKKKEKTSPPTLEILNNFLQGINLVNV